MTSSIKQITGFGHLTDLPCWQLSYAGATVVVSSYGAHVLHYAPASEQSSLFWLSPTAVWQQQQPIRGGVPVCWPWFGKLNPALLPAAQASNISAQKLPNHGLVRTRHWQVVAQEISAKAVTIEFAISVYDIPWNAEKVELRYQLRLDQQLTLTLSCAADIAQQAALHSYFTVTDSSQSVVQPLPTQYYDKVTDSQQHSSSDNLQFHGEIDRVYPDTAPSLQLTAGANKIQISQQGHDASVLWNPAPIKAAASADIPAGDWSHFVCVETARLQTSAAPLVLVQIIQPAE